VDAAGSVFFADAGSVRKVSPDGIITTVENERLLTRMARGDKPKKEKKKKPTKK
jgi:hypothetical protein